MNIILGAGISGISASFELKNNNIDSTIFEKNNSWGGLLDNFQINGFRFDKFIHLSFSQDDYVNSIFTKTPFIRHNPLSYNYYKRYWLKHPAQNNLFPLSQSEKNLIINDFKLSKEVKIEELKNYEEWLRMQFGDYFAVERWNKSIIGAFGQWISAALFAGRQTNRVCAINREIL